MTIPTVSSPFSPLSTPSMQTMQRPNHLHSVLPQGNTSTTSAAGTGAVQSFGSILSGIMDAATK
jgi:hypothetical protein